MRQTAPAGSPPFTRILNHTNIQLSTKKFSVIYLNTANAPHLSRYIGERIHFSADKPAYIAIYNDFCRRNPES